MGISQKPLLTDAFLRSLWAADYESFKDTEAEAALRQRLERWAGRRDLGETASEAAFIDTFFVQTWGYHASGQSDASTFTYRQQFPIPGSGQAGGTGRADLALGYFTGEDETDRPQVVCEFKGVNGSLDTPQRRQGKLGGRTSVEQARDYLWGARRGLYGNEDVIPEWVVVSNMREFRLYWFDRMPHDALIFTVGGSDLFDRDRGLLQDDDEGRFRRFVFARVFHRNVLLSLAGPSQLRRLIDQQGTRQRRIEKEFYQEYKALRDRLYNALVTGNPKFEGTKGRLLRLAQRILDRLLFVLYCEDRGGIIGFPPALLRDFLRAESLSRFYDEASDDVWRRIQRLFRTMNTGGNFGGTIQQFNGGLFADDPEIDRLFVPNYVFCTAGQGRNDATLSASRETVLYLSATYDFSSTGQGEGLDLYTLGHIFEQSITELEIQEAELDDRPSIGNVSKRKRDGVYYTPEIVVRAIVAETIAPRLDELKVECGWADGLPPDLAAVDQYEARLWQLRLRAKPKDNNYFEANRQFIAHLPVPVCAGSIAARIAELGEQLQTLHTLRCARLRNAERRLEILHHERRSLEWLLPGADTKQEQEVRLEALRRHLPARATIEPCLQDGELKLRANGRTIVEQVFVSPDEAPLVLNGWRLLVRTFPITANTKPKDLAERLRQTPTCSNRAAADQFVQLMDEVLSLEQQILAAEQETNSLVYAALGLSEDERALVEFDRAPVFALV